MNRSFTQTTFNLLRGFCSRFSPQQSTTRNSRRSTLSYANVEPRRLLAGIKFNATTGEVLIGGTAEDDIARVTQSGSTITVTQSGFESQTFNAARVNLIAFVGLGGDDLFDNRTSIDSIAWGHAGNDRLIGGSGNDRLIGNSDDDILRGNAGNDILIAGLGDDHSNGGAGDDRVLGVEGTNRIEGGFGNDKIFGGSGKDTITDIGGENLLVGGDGNDAITGGNDSDQIFGGNGSDVLKGSGGDDIIYAQNGNDFVFGGTGDDVVGGNNGNDVLYGEQGNDRIIGGNGTDRATFSGNLSANPVARSGPNVRVGDNVVIGAEQFRFFDGVRAKDELFGSARSREVITVQPIIASNSNGTNTAEFFGNAQQEQEIKAKIDAIYAQANIDIEFLPAKHINSTFINEGRGGSRPNGDLNHIVFQGDSEGVGNRDNNVIDFYFVETVPGFDDLGDDHINGLAFVGGSGVAMHVGDNRLASVEDRNTIARIAAHEIGHNLGLNHVSGENNLLSETGRSTLLTQSQIDIALASPITRPVA